MSAPVPTQADGGPAIEESGAPVALESASEPAPASEVGTKRDREPEAAEPSTTNDLADGASDAQQQKIEEAFEAGKKAQQNGDHPATADDEAPSKKRKVDQEIETEKRAPSQNGTVAGGSASTTGQPKSANLNALESESSEKTKANPAVQNGTKSNGASKPAEASSVPSAREPPPTSKTATDRPSTDVDPLQDAPAPPQTAPGDDEHLAHPEKWATGDEAATSKQKGFIAVLEKKAGQTGPDGITGGEGLTKAEASERIEDLKSSTS